MTRLKSPRDQKDEDKASSSSIAGEISPKKRRISGENNNQHEHKNSQNGKEYSNNCGESQSMKFDEFLGMIKDSCQDPS